MSEDKSVVNNEDTESDYLFPNLKDYPDLPDYTNFNPLTPKLIAFKRALFESLYTGRLTAWTLSSERSSDPNSALEEKTKTVLLEDVPCRIIRQSGPQTESNPKTYDTSIKVMLAPEIKVPAGSILTIEFYGHKKDYRQSGEPVFHSDHQTIMVEVYREGRSNKA